MKIGGDALILRHGPDDPDPNVKLSIVYEADAPELEPAEWMNLERLLISLAGVVVELVRARHVQFDRERR